MNGSKKGSYFSPPYCHPEEEYVILRRNEVTT